jgi:nitrous oxidase accessory protein
VLESNETDGGRDVVLWFSKNLKVTGNRFYRGRYGLHFMYCRDAVVENNTLTHNSVGAYLMYSRGLTLRKNITSDNRGPSGSGIGFKDMESALVEDNIVVNNRVGLFLDGSEKGICRGNIVAYNDIGFQVFPTARHNRFERNNVIDNTEQVILDGQSVYTVNDWTGNYWSDYRGYDIARDGVGDISHRPMKLFERLSDRLHALKIFSGSPSVAAIDFAAATFPIFQPTAKFSDDKPLMEPVMPPVTGKARPAFLPWLLVSAALLSPLFIFWPRESVAA